MLCALGLWIMHVQWCRNSGGIRSLLLLLFYWQKSCTVCDKTYVSKNSNNQQSSTWESSTKLGNKKKYWQIWTWSFALDLFHSRWTERGLFFTFQYNKYESSGFQYGILGGLPVSHGTVAVTYEWVSVMGWQNQLKFNGKTNRLKNSTSKCLFLLFWPVSCVSLISLIEIWSFCTKLLENYPFM